MSGALVGIDVGGTKIAASVVSGTRISRRVVVDTPASEGPAAVVDTVCAMVDTLLDGSRPAGVGIGSAGVIDDSGTVVAATDVIADWAETPLQAMIGRRLGAPVKVVNDVVAFLLGESVAGVAIGTTDVLAVTVGTGIGGALMIGGKVVRGHRSVAGHVGHLLSPLAVGLSCPCGRPGHIEAISSGPAMVRSYNSMVASAAPDMRALAAQAADGEPIARNVVDTAATALGAALGGLANAIAPELVVVGGGVVHGVESYFATLRDALLTAVHPALSSIRVERGSLGPDANLIGAASLMAGSSR